MKPIFNIHDFLSGNLDEVCHNQDLTDVLTESLQDAATSDNILRQVQEVTSTNKPLGKKMKLVVSNKNKNDNARFERLLEYVLDEETLVYLEANRNFWMADLDRFDGTKAPDCGMFESWVQVISTHLETEQDNV